MTEQIPGPDRSSPAPRRAKREVVPGKHAQADGLELRSYDVGALPLLNRIVERMQLQRILNEHLSRDDSRTELSTVTSLLVLFANLLMAREPVYGIGEWAARERSISFGSRGDPCCSRKCLLLKMVPASRLVIRT
jgi:hypothetical protein